MVDETEEDLVVLVKKPNATSIVWNYFGLEANKEGTPKPDKNPFLDLAKEVFPRKVGTQVTLWHTTWSYMLKRFQLRSRKTEECC